MSEGTQQNSPCLPQPYPPGVQIEAVLDTEGNMCNKEGCLGVLFIKFYQICCKRCIVINTYDREKLYFKVAFFLKDIKLKSIDRKMLRSGPIRK